MSDPVRLIPKQTAAEEIKADVISILREHLERAERGEFDGVVVICRRSDGSWCDERSALVQFSDAIGKLEIIKHDWIRQFRGY